MMNAKFVVFLFLFIGLKLNAQFNYNSKVSALHFNVLQLNMPDNEPFLNQLDEKNGIIYWLQAYNEFLNLHFGNNSYSTHQYIKNADSYIAQIKKLEKDSPFYNFCLADIYLFSAYAYLKDESYFYAAGNLMRAQKHIERNQNKFPHFYLNNRHKIIQIAIDYWIDNNISVWNNNENCNYHEKFNRLINKTISNVETDSVFRKEIKLLSGGLNHVFFASNDSVNNLINNYGSDWALNGPLEMLVYTKNFQKTDKNKTKYLLSSACEKGYSDKCNQLNLLLGSMYLNELNDSSEYFLKLYCNNQPDGNDVLFAKFKLSWFYFINDKTVLFDNVVSEIRYKPEAKTLKDKQALYELNSMEHWNKNIVIARLLFDGGNYTQALGVLLENKSKIRNYTEIQRLEYSYRLARIYDKMNEKQKALVFYNMVVSSNLDDGFYYPAYAAYYSGILYEQQLNYSLAINYFNYCRHLNSPIYKESIHRRATIAIKRCEKAN